MFYNGRAREEFDGKFECFGENTGKYITFSVPIKKEVDNGKTITYKIKFTENLLITSSLSSLVDELSEGIHRDKCTDCKASLDYMVLKDYQLIFRRFECQKIYKKDSNKKLSKRFANMYEFCNGDIDKLFFLLRKSVCPYEYMDSWEIFDETSLSDKGAFFSSVNMEDITDVDYCKKLLKYFSNKNLGDYHDFYVQSDTLLPADVFENFRNKCIEIYEQDPAHFLSAPSLAW